MAVFEGQLLREARLRAGLRPTLVAAAVDRSVESLRGYERGSITPPADVVGALAEVIGCSPADFYANHAADTRTAQGLPPVITDEAVLARIAAILKRAA